MPCRLANPPSHPPTHPPSQIVLQLQSSTVPAARAPYSRLQLHFHWGLPLPQCGGSGHCPGSDQGLAADQRGRSGQGCVCDQKATRRGSIQLPHVSILSSLMCTRSLRVCNHPSTHVVGILICTAVNLQQSALNSSRFYDYA